MVLHLQNFDIIRIIIPHTAQSQHHTGENRLHSILFIAGNGEGQSDTSLLVLDPNLGLCAQHIIDGGFGHGNNGRDGSTDNVSAAFGIAAVSGNGESGDSVVLGKKLTSGHGVLPITVRSW